MSVDGFSISNFNLPKDITSAQAAATAEQIALVGNDKVVGKIDRVLNKKVDNEEKEENQKNKYFDDGYESSEEDEEENLENDDEKDKKISLKNVKKYKNYLLKDPENVGIRINTNRDKIELYNKITNKILETINADDFLDMINKLDYNSGILVNLKI